MIEPVLIDSNVLIAIFDRTDVHGKRASRLWEIMHDKNVGILYPDCVVNETFSVIGRRLNEKGRKLEVRLAFERMERFFKPENIFWTYSYAKKFIPEIIQLMKEHNGIFSFHDALIALVAKQEGLRYILSFDSHFDLFPWIKRISEAGQLSDI